MVSPVYSSTLMEETLKLKTYTYALAYERGLVLDELKAYSLAEAERMLRGKINPLNATLHSFSVVNKDNSKESIYISKKYYSLFAINTISGMYKDYLYYAESLEEVLSNFLLPDNHELVCIYEKQYLNGKPSWVKIK